MVEVITPAATTGLTTLARVKSELEIADTSMDTLLTSWIADASAEIVRFCGRPFARETYRETLSGYGGTRLMLARTPVVSVASVLHNSDVITDFVINDADAGLLYRERGWQWSAGVGWNITSYVVPGSEAPKFVVEYTAGYLLPGAATPTLPGDIERACIELVKAVHAARKRDPAITAERLGDYQASYAEGMPAQVVDRLIRWRRSV